MKTPNFKSYPVLPVRDTLVLPGIGTPLSVGRPKSIAALKYANAERESWVLILTQKSDAADPTPDDLYRVGTLVNLEKLRGTDEHGYQVLSRGMFRYHVSEIKLGANGFLEAQGEILKEEVDTDPSTAKALLASLKELAAEMLRLLPADTTQLAELVEGVTDLSFLFYLCLGSLEIDTSEKQALFEIRSLKDRVLKLLEVMNAQKDTLKVQGEIREKIAGKLGKMQRESILREQLKTIREELGEESDEREEADYRKKIEDAAMPADVKKTALEELKRLETIGSQSPETHVIRNYLDLLCALPWSKSGPETIDIEAARKVLADDHYGLDKIKKRIIQHLAVMKLKKETSGSILLLVGPPGVGKTSLGQSIAKALGRKFIRASLGGVRDDSEIRGHRRTYIGAMPGRIIQSLKRAGENNPVMILDEIDKLSVSFQGDPAGALLEVLDPEQNKTFLDHYLDVPFDLSKVFFIATANSLETIPRPLLDRMEVIEVNGYTTAEKFHIAKNHLIPKQLKEHGMTSSQLEISDEALLLIISAYTREAGVRELQRKIAEVCRGSTEKVLEAKQGVPVRVEFPDLDAILGPERFVHEVAEGTVQPGVVTGLAWTPQGGEILFVEAASMPGKGGLTITGQLGDVMKESAQIALSLVRSHLGNLSPELEFEKKDIHLHVPAGAIPKDGPSAGIAMLSALASLVTGRKIDPKLAMTGEITLRGAVMPVGGIKEKVIAAHRAGIRKVLLPKRNEKDLREIPEDIKKDLQFEFVESAEEVIRIVLGISLIAPRTATPLKDDRIAIA